DFTGPEGLTRHFGCSLSVTNCPVPDWVYRGWAVPPCCKETMRHLLFYIDGVFKELGVRYIVTDGVLLGSYKFGGMLDWDADVDLHIHDDDFHMLEEVVQHRVRQDGHFLRKHANNRSWLLQANEQNYLLIELNLREEFWDPDRVWQVPIEGRLFPAMEDSHLNLSSWYGMSFFRHRLRHVPEWEEDERPMYCSTPYHYNCVDESQVFSGKARPSDRGSAAARGASVPPADEVSLLSRDRDPDQPFARLLVRLDQGLRVVFCLELQQLVGDLEVEVCLLSGKTAAVKAELDETVGALNMRAQTTLGVGRGRLLDSFGNVLDMWAPIKATRVQNGDSLTLQVSYAQVQASWGALAAIMGDGCVETWGDAAYGGDSSAVQDQLKTVQHIQATREAFAAILSSGSVVTWGDARNGGDSSAVQDQLKSVQKIQATSCAFAAILDDGCVVTWGDDYGGGDSSAVRDQLTTVQQIQASNTAFAAIRGDGSVVTWGGTGLHGQLKNVQQIQASFWAFAAILGDGSVVTWGLTHHGGDSSAVQGQLKNVQQIQSATHSFAALLGNGSVVTWGNDFPDDYSSAAEDQLQNVQQILGAGNAFAAILGDGSVVTWGRIGAVRHPVKNVQHIQSSGDGGLAAILHDGSVVTSCRRSV
ncbi:Fkrp, partial [Symbiodinium sp. KB8]